MNIVLWAIVAFFSAFLVGAIILTSAPGLFWGTALFLIAALWLTSPFIGAMIWRRKGGAQTIGLIAGFLLGPFVMLMLFASPTTRKCPHCAVPIPKEARICPMCQSPQP